MRIEIPITLIDPDTHEDVPMWAIIDKGGVRHVPREPNEGKEQPDG